MAGRGSTYKVVQKGPRIHLRQGLVLGAKLQRRLRIEGGVIGYCGRCGPPQLLAELLLYRDGSFCLLLAQGLQPLPDNLLRHTAQLGLGLPYAQVPQQLLPIVVVDGLVRIELLLDLHLERL